MRSRDSNDAIASILAALGDAATVWLGSIAAVWIRFDSGWMSVPFGRPQSLYYNYGVGALLAMPLYLIVFQILDGTGRVDDVECQRAR